MKKKIIIIIVSCFLLLSIGSVSLVLLLNDDDSTNENNEIIEKELEKLSKPLNLVIDQYSLTWNKVENAEEYLINVDNLQYFSKSNNFDLTDKVNENSIISVVALGNDKFDDSVKSVEIVFRNQKDETQINQIYLELNDLLNKHFVIKNNIQESVYNIAERIYMRGLTSSDACLLMHEIDSMLENVDKLSNFNKINNLQMLFLDMVDILSLDVNEYALVSGLVYFFEAYSKVASENEKINLNTSFTTEYYDLSLYQTNFQTIHQKLSSLKEFDIQNVTSLLHYYKIYRNQVSNIVNTMEKTNLDNVNTVYNDVLTLKNMLCDLLLNEMPLVLEFEGFKTLFTDLYNLIFEGYLQEKVTSDEINSYFNNLYSVNEYYLSFLNSLEDSDYKVIVTRLLSFVNSINSDDIDGFKEVIELIDANSPNYILNIVIKHFDNVFIDYDLTINQEFVETIIDIFQEEDPVTIVNRLVEYLQVFDYIDQNDDILYEVVDYLISLFPDSIQSGNDLGEYFESIINSINLEDYYEIRYEEVFNDLNLEKILNSIQEFIEGNITQDELEKQIISLIDVDKILVFDVDKLMSDIISLIQEDIPKLAEFINEVLLLDEITIKNILEIMGIDHRVDVDINGFVENLKNKIGINVDALFIENKILEFVDNVVEEIRGKTSKVEKYFKILAIFTNPNYEFSEDDLEELFKEDTIDFGSLFILMDHLKVKYAKFQIKHDPIYENGLDFNLEHFEENLFNCFVYLYFGQHAYAGEEFSLSVVDLTYKIVDLYQNFDKFIEIIDHYENLLQSMNIQWDDFIDLYNKETEFNELMNVYREELDYTYQSLKYILDVLPLDEVIKLKYCINNLLASYGYEHTQEIYQFIKIIEDSYYKLIEEIDTLYGDFVEKEEAIKRLYYNTHVLVDPVYEYYQELEEIYYSDGELSDDDIIDIVSNVISNKTKLNSFYNPVIIQEIGSDLDIIFGDQVIDFNKEVLEIIFYFDFIYNRINASNAVSTTVGLAQDLMKILEDVDTFKTIFIELQELLNNTEISNEDKKNEFDKLYTKLMDTYELIKTNSLLAVQDLDLFMLKGIQDLSQTNPEYTIRQEEFLFEDELIKVFEKMDQIMNSLDVEDIEDLNLDFTSIIINLLQNVDILK